MPLSKNQNCDDKKITIIKGQKISGRLVVGLQEKAYKSTNKKVATVNKKGIIKAVGKGKTVIKIKAEDKKIYKVKISVKKNKTKGYNNSLKTKKGKVIIKFNTPVKDIFGEKIIRKKNKYLEDNSEDYYYAKTKDGQYIALLMTKKPLPELSSIYGINIKINEITPLGYIGNMTGHICAGLQDGTESIFPNLKTNQGNFYSVCTRYQYSSSDERDSTNYVNMITMNKNGYYITLYGEKEFNNNFNKIAKELFN